MISGVTRPTSKRGHKFNVNTSFDEIDPSEYDALVVPGGRAPEYLRTYDIVLDTVQHFFEADKPVAALCHGPQILAAADVLDEYEMTAYPAVRAEVESAGCSWVDEVTVDQNLVTGQAWPDHPEWLSAFLELLEPDVAAEEPTAADD